MTDKPSFTQLVRQVLMMADRPLTVDEIVARVETTRPVDTRNPGATIRGAIGRIRQAASLGGRPAHYTWWPHHLANNTFRQPLADSDLEAGTLALSKEVWAALWPDFHGGASRSKGDVALQLADGPTLQARIQHLVEGKAIWGLPPTLSLAEWYRRQRATPQDALIVRVLDVDTRRYAVDLGRWSDRDEAAIVARNQTLADVAEKIARAGRPPVASFDLIPRLIAHDVYRAPLPPDPWEGVLQADLRFVVRNRDLFLSEKIVDDLEQDLEIHLNRDAALRPQGDRRKARSAEARRAWGEYLFDRGMDHRWVDWAWAAEAYYRQALQMDPGHADAWVHIGNIRFDEGKLDEALAHYKRGQAAAEARVIGDPARYAPPFWLDVDSRPFMRALHGRGLCLWRLGRVEEARQVFAWMLDLNPNDNQGVRFLLHDIDEGLSWEESAAQEDAWHEEQAKAFHLARIWGSQPDDVIH